MISAIQDPSRSIPTYMSGLLFYLKNRQIPVTQPVTGILFVGILYLFRSLIGQARWLSVTCCFLVYCLVFFFVADRPT